MSRIGKQPVAIPAGVTVEEKRRLVTVKGPKGQLQLELRPEIDGDFRLDDAEGGEAVEITAGANATITGTIGYCVI